MKVLHIRVEQTVADPRQSEHQLKARKILLAHREGPHASIPLGQSLDQPTTARRDHQAPTALAQALHSATGIVAPAST